LCTRRSQSDWYKSQCFSRDSTIVISMEYVRSCSRDNCRYFPCTADKSPSLVQEWDYRVRRRTQSEKSQDVSDEIGPWSISQTFVRRWRYRFNSRWICVVLCARGRTQVPGPTNRNRRQFPRSAFGNTEALPSFHSSSPSKVKGFLFVLFRFYSFLPLRFRLSAFLYVHTYKCTYTRKPVCERGHSRFSYISVVDMYGRQAFSVHLVHLYIYIYIYIYIYVCVCVCVCVCIYYTHVYMYRQYVYTSSPRYIQRNNS